MCREQRISDYLHSLGYNPVKQQGGNLWYKSPFRQENEPSFKVNTELNLWYDFGAGKGGNIIALAKRECKELHFTHNGKPYFAMGFPNVAGGYEVRNSFFKGCIALDGQDYVILNSTANVTKALDVLYPYERIHCLLDNDHAGWKATREIEREYSCRVRDFSHEYRGYADLNGYLCGKRQEQDLGLPQQGKQDRPSGQQEQEPTMKKSRGGQNVGVCCPDGFLKKP